MSTIPQHRTTAGLVAWAVVCVAAVASAADAPRAARWSIGKPIVTYWAGPEMTQATARQMAEGGWNVVWCREQDLDVAQRNGLRGMLVAPGLLAPATLESPEKRQELDALLERVAKHPALYCYFIVDEPNASAFPALGKLVAYLRARDPAHMAYINLFPTYANNRQLGTSGDTVTAYKEHLRQFVETVKPDLVSYDHYQFAADGDLEGYFLNLAMVRDAAQQARVPFLNIVQACSWTPARRVPQGDEMRYLIYTTLAYGAQGISYYVYCHPGHTGAIANPDGTPTPLYGALKSLNREFVAIAAQLQPLQSLRIQHLGMLPAGTTALPASAPLQLQPPVNPQPYAPPERVRGVAIGFFGPDKNGAATHAVVVNLDYKNPLKTTLVGAAPLAEFDATTETWSPLRDGSIPLELPPGGGKLVRWGL